MDWNNWNVDRDPNWNLVGNNGGRMVFTVPVGNLSPAEAERALAELIADYREDIQF